MSVAALKNKPSTRSSEREALANAIKQHVEALASLDKVRQTQEHASEVRTRAFAALEAAKTAQAAAKKNEGERLAAIALGEEVPGLSPADAAAAVTQAENDYTVTKNTQAALEQRQADAERALGWTEQELNDAVKVAAKADPVMQQVVANYKSAQAEYLNSCKLLSLLSDLGCTLLPSWGEGYAPQHNSVSQGPAPNAQRWQAAIEQLKTNADAPLPG